VLIQLTSFFLSKSRARLKLGISLEDEEPLIGTPLRAQIKLYTPTSENNVTALTPVPLETHLPEMDQEVEDHVIDDPMIVLNSMIITEQCRSIVGKLEEQRDKHLSQTMGSP
jgi:hypothetical protein